MHDEFEIRASSPDKEDRVWTRDTLDVSKCIADQAVSRLGYKQAVVRNTYGGHLSDPLYVAKRTYTIGTSDQGRETLTVNCPLAYLPFNVWRDVGRIAGKSWESETTVTYEFLVPNRLEESKQILHGALWEEG